MCRYLQGCLGVLLKILPTEDNDVRDLCSLVMRCLAGKEDLLLDLMAEPRLDVPSARSCSKNNYLTALYLRL